MNEAMTPEEFRAWKAAARKKYNDSVAKKWAEAKKPTDREMVIIKAIFPGYVKKIEHFMDIEINESARSQAERVIKALEEFDD